MAIVFGVSSAARHIYSKLYIMNKLLLQHLLTLLRKNAGSYRKISIAFIPTVRATKMIFRQTR
ncbi:hypothetical protein HDC92_001795 [Pedobacter sp. AK017]|nr:hypothetical protein [Pedobacter sp. AK017]